MKKKYLTYLLLGLVLLIWGYIFYKFFNDTAVKESPALSFPLNSMEDLNDSTRETFSLLANYRDPFLGRLSKPSQGTGMRFKKATVVMAVVTWPGVAYLGIISNATAKRQIGLVNINNIDYMVSSNDLIADLKVVKVDKHSIILAQKGKEKSFIKSGK